MSNPSHEKCNIFLQYENSLPTINRNDAILGLHPFYQLALNHILWDFGGIIWQQGRKICLVITRDKAKSGSRLPPLKSATTWEKTAGNNNGEI